MKMLFKALIGVGAVVLLFVAAIGIIYLTDTPIEANVIDNDCSGTFSSDASTVTIKTEFPIPGIVRKMEIDDSACGAVAALRADGEDPFVRYYPKSERTVIYGDHPDMGGTKIYDSG